MTASSSPHSSIQKHKLQAQALRSVLVSILQYLHSLSSFLTHSLLVLHPCSLLSSTLVSLLLFSALCLEACFEEQILSPRSSYGERCGQNIIKSPPDWCREKI